MTDPVADIDAMAERVVALLVVLERDPLCNWTAGFRTWLADATATRPGATREDAWELAVHLVRAFHGGMGSFNDYIPQVDGQIAPWAEEAEVLAGQVHIAAWAVQNRPEREL